MDPLVVLFGLGVGVLIGLTGMLGSMPGVWIGTALVAVGALAWLVHRLQFGKAPVAAWARTS